MLEVLTHVAGLAASQSLPVLHAVGTVVSSPSHVLWGDGTSGLAAPAASVIAAAPDLSVLHLYAVAGAVLGLFLRTLVPWLVRIRTGAAKFDLTYLLNTLYGAAGTVVAGQYLLPAISPGASPWTVFGGAVLAAWGLQSLAAHLVKVGPALQAAGQTTTAAQGYFAPLPELSQTEKVSEPIQVPLTPAQVQAQAKPIAPPAKPGVKPRPTIDLKDNNS